ncbi:DNA sulfur modification protein DndB [Nocardia sp. XZ_19_385]|uniref:DNA sulfur modification protein DndB n=1 Tax=Nocardia sp. XZ_19_385 TaxID=2769488 RepID=UPI00188E0C2C|nr:DNA sulfur modification protein DndB [Nocardia sp. XZ_19_385]
MSIQTTEYATEINRGLGDPLRVLELSPSRLLTTMPWGQLARIVPDPRKAENTKALRFLSKDERDQAETRNEVQRNIKSTKKAENAKAYARYLAEVLRGDRDQRWATPPFALWVRRPLDVVQLPSTFGVDSIAYLPWDVSGVLVDAETQHLAHFLLREDPDAYGISSEQTNGRLVGVEIYHGMDLVAARQIFHDRNLLGVIPNKTVALASDSANVATRITLALLDKIEVRVGAKVVNLKDLVSVRQRQLGASDTEWMTLSTLRSFVITMIFGKAGFDKTSGPLPALPEGCTEEIALAEIQAALSELLTRFASAFERRTTTVIASPAVFSALGAVAHRTASWNKDPQQSLSVNAMLELLVDVHWERDARYWDGTAGKLTASGAFSLAGGVKDNGSKTTSALADPTSPRYEWIRHGRSDFLI